MRLPGTKAIFAISLGCTLVALAAGLGRFGQTVQMLSSLYLPALSIFVTVAIHLAWANPASRAALALNVVWCLALFAGDDLVLDPAAFAERIAPSARWPDAGMLRTFLLAVPPVAAAGMMYCGLWLLRWRLGQTQALPADG